MDKQAVLPLYIEAVLPERESYLYQRALNKTRAITRNMKPEEVEEYLQSKAFANALYHIKQSDKAYQALRRGELILDFHQAEFERLAPLMLSERRQGNPVNLAFLRSVDRCRVPLKKARAALRLLNEQAPRKALEAQTARLAESADGKLERYLRQGDLSRLVEKDRDVGRVLDYILDNAFARGVPASVVEQAFQPRTLTRLLQDALNQACPEIAACGGVSTESGETVAAVVKGEIRRAKNNVCAQVRKRFPAARLRRLLAANASLKRLQKQADAAFAKERRLRSALLSAVPEHYRDLYPLARQMRRHFILHLGPTNSGKTYEGVGRLHGARCGIYLGPLRLLAAEQFETLNLNDVPCSVVTGEDRKSVVPGAILHG